MTGTYTQTRTEVVLSQLEALPKLSVRFEMPDTVVSFVCFLDKSFVVCVRESERCLWCMCVCVASVACAT
jgi:hypothetical protein